MYPPYDPTLVLPSSTISPQGGGSNWQDMLGTFASALQGLRPQGQGASPQLNAAIAQLGQPMQPLMSSQTPTAGSVGGTAAAGGAPPGMSPLSQLGPGPGGGMGVPGGGMATSGPANPVTGSAVGNAYLASLGGNPNANPTTGRGGWWPGGYGA